MFIRSERLFLRPGWPEDWQDIQRQIGTHAIVCNLARAPWPYRAEDAQAFAALPQDPRTPHFVVTLPGSRGAQLIGGIGRVPVMRDTVYRPVGNERRVQSFGAPELAPVVQTPPRKVVAAE